MNNSVEKISVMPTPRAMEVGKEGWSQKWTLETSRDLSAEELEFVGESIAAAALHSMRTTLSEQGFDSSPISNTDFAVAAERVGKGPVTLTIRYNAVLNSDMVFPLRAIQEFSRQCAPVLRIEGHPWSVWQSYFERVIGASEL